MRLIDADELFPGGVMVRADNGLDTAQRILGAINNAPTVEAEPVVHGRWIDKNQDVPDWSYRKSGMSYYCSNCKHLAGKYKHNTYKYCPWCGAKMQGDDAT